MSELLKINVNENTEKKNGLTYLSWAWAWSEVLKHDPLATWVCHTYGPQGAEEPCMRIGKTAMVHVSVTIKGLRRECMLPVMDHRNKAIPDPDAFAVNTAIMRCMTKAIGMHGLGLYIYAGEDLPEEDADKKAKSAGSDNGSPGAIIFSGLQPDIQAMLRKAAPHIDAAMPDTARAIQLIEMAVDNWPDEDQSQVKAGLWYLLDSKTRSAIKTAMKETA